MTSVFLLWHMQEFPDGSDSNKLIGVYETRSDAEQAIVRVGSQPGFVDMPEGFLIDEYPLGKDHWTEGFVRTE
ncbi:MAG: hypothetical protein JO093_21095 [Acidobacteria bacterium]|nr:hypothetical protein [Acidobacteriota bacterium]MBV9068695.1 hypothetical protein [Acidobacteriota bacterium]MBV9188120.1 hypothetical protein [Acidobacteriota bacterium]